MDDLEFQKRALANPQDCDEDFIAAAETSQQRQSLLQNAKELDAKIHGVLLSVSSPAELANRLRAIPTQTATVVSLPVKSRTNRYYAMVASLVLAIGILFSSNLLSTRPSAADLKFHDDIIGHVHREAPRYENSTVSLSWQQISQVIAEAGGHLRDDERIKKMRIKFANDCNVIPSSKGAHIVLEGSKGSVSVIMIHSSPVSTKFDVDDPRFTGKIIPFGEGNVIILGEKEEPLESYESLIAETFEWLI
jgi:hypothetical protein